MRVLLAGAGGAIGTQLVPLLTAAGHTVAGTTRSPGKADRIRELGAEPVVCDVYDAGALTAAVMAFAPDAVINQLTDLPADPSRMPEKAEDNNRIRREGTRNLIAAAQAAGAERLLAQSVAFDVPGDGGAAVREHEQAVLDAGGVVLRYGYFHGPGTWYEDEPAPPPAVHVAEAARRTVAALEDAPGGTVLTILDQ